MVKQTVLHSCCRIPLSNKKKQAIDTHNLDETPENYEQKKKILKDCIRYDSII